MFQEMMPMTQGGGEAGYLLDQVLNTNYANPTFTVENGAKYFVVVVSGWSNNNYGASITAAVQSVTNGTDFKEEITPYSSIDVSGATSNHSYSAYSFTASSTSVTLVMASNYTTMAGRSFILFKKTS